MNSLYYQQGKTRKIKKRIETEKINFSKFPNFFPNLYFKNPFSDHIAWCSFTYTLNF